MTLNNLAGLYESQGKYDEAEPLYTRALGILLRSVGPSHPHFRGAFWQPSFPVLGEGAWMTILQWNKWCASWDRCQAYLERMTINKLVQIGVELNLAQAKGSHAQDDMAVSHPWAWKLAMRGIFS